MVSKAFLFGLLLLAFWPFGCALNVKTVDEFLKVFESASGNVVSTNINILADLDFSGKKFTHPLGCYTFFYCRPYSGTIHGNGHSIRGFKINNTERPDFNRAGLFCELKGATIENLVIESSCSFAGETTGALAPLSSGSLQLINVTNKAQLSSQTMLGGFIGVVESSGQGETVLLIKDCINEEAASHSEKISGGFFGWLKNVVNLQIQFINSKNIRTITGNNYYLGGFVAYIMNFTNVNLFFCNCTNIGTVAGQDVKSAGFIGNALSGSQMTVTFVNSSNTGRISGEGPLGGFVGSASAISNLDVTFTNCFNDGGIRGTWRKIGGFIGSFNPLTKSTLSFLQSISF